MRKEKGEEIKERGGGRGFRRTKLCAIPHETHAL